MRQGTVDTITAPASTVILEIEAVTPSLLEALRPFGKMEHTDTRLTVAVPSEAAIPDLVAATVAAGGRLRAVTPVRESLEDAFVRVMEEKA